MDRAPSNASFQLAPLEVPAPSASCYQQGPSASVRMGVLSPGRGLKHIERIEINHFVDRGGVTFYVLDVFLWKQHAQPQAKPSRIVGMPVSQAPSSCSPDAVLIDVDLNAVPAYQLERRFSDFEMLRHTLSVCFENLHPGNCRYCDTFISFLACSAIQPGLYTKLTTRAPQRKNILAKFINHAITLALASSEDDDGVHGACDGGSIIPQVVESFLRDQRSVFTQ